MKLWYVSTLVISAAFTRSGPSVSILVRRQTFGDFYIREYSPTMASLMRALRAIGGQP